MRAVTATCGICGKRYDTRDPAITWWAIGDEWACTEEGPCFERAAMNELKGGIW